MGKQILAALVWADIVFILLGTITYFTGVDGWFVETLKWVIPSALGYLLGYGQARRDENR